MQHVTMLFKHQELTETEVNVAGKYRTIQDAFAGQYADMHIHSLQKVS